MAYKVTGIRNGKRYTSRKKFTTTAKAVEYGYRLTYNHYSGTKRKNQLHDWKIIED